MATNALYDHLGSRVRGNDDVLLDCVTCSFVGMTNDYRVDGL